MRVSTSIAGPQDQPEAQWADLQHWSNLTPLLPHPPLRREVYTWVSLYPSWTDTTQSSKERGHRAGQTDHFGLLDWILSFLRAFWR